MAAGINLVKVMLSLLAIVTLLPLTLAKSWANVSVKSTQFIGRQQTPDVTQVSRDGGFSSLVSGNSIWIYDDTECLGSEGNMLSFVANTAATSNPTTNVSEVHTYGVKQAGRDSRGRKMYAVVKQDIISTGGWISLTSDELDFNQKKKGLERFAICEHNY